MRSGSSNATSLAALGAVVGTTGAARNASQESAAACSFSNGVEHLIYIVFDNTHYRRDLADVPSDLEQMPHLLDFMTSNGTLLTNDHTILISHTAGGILSGMTGLYPDRHGVTVSTGYGYYKDDGVPASTSAFKYWTSPVDGVDDPLPNMVGTEWQSRTTPAPWLTFTHAGWSLCYEHRPPERVHNGRWRDHADPRSWLTRMG